MSDEDELAGGRNGKLQLLILNSQRSCSHHSVRHSFSSHAKSRNVIRCLSSAQRSERHSTPSWFLSASIDTSENTSLPGRSKRRFKTAALIFAFNASLTK